MLRGPTQFPFLLVAPGRVGAEHPGQKRSRSRRKRDCEPPARRRRLSQGLCEACTVQRRSVLGGGHNGRVSAPCSGPRLLCSSAGLAPIPSCGVMPGAGVGGPAAACACRSCKEGRVESRLRLPRFSAHCAPAAAAAHPVLHALPTPARGVGGAARAGAGRCSRGGRCQGTLQRLDPSLQGTSSPWEPSRPARSTAPHRRPGDTAGLRGSWRPLPSSFLLAGRPAEQGSKWLHAAFPVVSIRH